MEKLLFRWLEGSLKDFGTKNVYILECLPSVSHSGTLSSCQKEYMSCIFFKSLHSLK